MSDLRRCLGTDEAQPSGHAVDVGIDRKRLTTKRKQQHTRRGFRAHAGQGTKVGIGVLIAELVQTL